MLVCRKTWQAPSGFELVMFLNIPGTLSCLLIILCGALATVIHLRHFMSRTFTFDLEAKSTLKDTLSCIWQKFHEEYLFVSTNDLDARYSEILTIETD